MQRLMHFIMAAALLALASGEASAQSHVDRSGSLPVRSASLSVDGAPRQPSRQDGLRALVAGPVVLPPIGWVEFCAHPDHDSDCKVEERPAAAARADGRTRRLLARVNRNVNAAVAPMSDMENYGVEEVWAYPENGRGDCEDYVLLKRKLLIEAGVPRQALLVTVVREPNGDGHAVLTVVTDRGDLILDNKRDDIRVWSAAGYDFVKRQSAENPNVWVDLRAAAALVARR